MSKKQNTPPKKTSTEVARVGSAKLPAKIEDRFLQFEGAGMENVSARDLTIPRLTLLQGLSPQCQKSKPEFIKGAQPGMFCDTATGQLWDGDDGPILLPVYYQLSWLEWAPRKTNKGLIAIHADDAILRACEKNDKGQWVTEAGNIVSETAQFYVLNRSQSDRQVFVPFAGSQRKKAKKWLDLATTERIKHSSGKEFIPPLFYREYKCTAVEESNDQGEWFGWKIERGNTIEDDDDAFNKAMSYLKAVQSGAMRMSNEELMRESTQEAEGNSRAGGRM